MAVYDYVISVEGRSLLSSLLGRRLKSVEGYRYDLVPIEGKTTFYAVARLHMEDGDHTISVSSSSGLISLLISGTTRGPIPLAAPRERSGFPRESNPSSSPLAE